MVVIGADALRHVREPKQILLASLPLLFGLHQLDEAFVWWGLQGRVSESLERIGIWVYLLFALAALPMLVPLAVFAIERSPGRKRLIGAFAILGIAVGVSLGVALFRGSVNAAIASHHIAYDVERVAVRVAISRGCTSSPRAAHWSRAATATSPCSGC